MFTATAVLKFENRISLGNPEHFCLLSIQGRNPKDMNIFETSVKYRAEASISAV